MPQMMSCPEQVQNQIQEVVQEARPWLERLGRFGFATKGLVYGIVGALAAQAAAGFGDGTTDVLGALERILLAPFGQYLLLLTAGGLLGHASWRFVQAVFDTERKGTDARGIWARSAYVVIGLIYVGLAVSAAELLWDLPGEDELGELGDSTESWTAWLLAKPFGQWLAGIVGGLVIFNGLFQLYRALTADFCSRLRLREMSESQVRLTIWIGRLGFLARGVAYTIIGSFLVLAAMRANPDEAHGLGETLAILGQEPFGPWLLAAVAFGLLAYGVYMLVEARFRRMVLD